MRASIKASPIMNTVAFPAHISLSIALLNMLSALSLGLAF